MKLYPAKADAKVEPAVDESQLAQDMIIHIENGAPEGYFPDDNGRSRTGEELTAPHIKALAMAGRDIPKTAQRVLEEILTDAKNMVSVNIREFDTATLYKARLAEVKKHLDENAWYNGVLEVNDVTKWTDLKKIYPTYGMSPPSVPKNVNVNVESFNTLTVSWDASTAGSSGLGYYTIYLNANKKRSVPGDVISTSIIVDADTRYSVQISATNGDGYESSLSDSVVVTTPKIVSIGK